MKTIWTMLIAALAAVSLQGVPVQAQEMEGDVEVIVEEDAPATQADMTTTAGTVASMDKKAKTFMLETEGGEMVKVMCSADTEYMMGEKKAKMGDVIKKGQMVSVEHMDGKASTVTAMPMDDEMDDDAMDAGAEVEADVDM